MWDRRQGAGPTAGGGKKEPRFLWLCACCLCSFGIGGVWGSHTEQGRLPANPDAAARRARARQPVTTQAKGKGDGSIQARRRGHARPRANAVLAEGSRIQVPRRPGRGGVQALRYQRFTVTAYCPCARCCGSWADGITASGRPVTANGGRFVAAPRGFPSARCCVSPATGRFPFSTGVGQSRAQGWTCFSPHTQRR